MREQALRTLGQKVRLIVCDLDGTLLNSQKELTPRSCAAAKAAAEKGIYFTICSGRIHTMLEAYVHTLAITGPVIAANGAVLLNAADHSLLDAWEMPAHDTALLLEACRTEQLDYSALCEEGCWFSENSIRIKRFEQYNEIARAQGMREIPLHFFGGNHQQALQNRIFKMLIYQLRPGDLEKARGVLDRLPGVQYSSSDEGLLDITCQGTDKGVAVKRLAERMGLQREEICVFGDFGNDLPMFQQAGFAVAMGNAEPEVKNGSLFITGTNDQDGVAEAIEKYIL